MYNLNNAQKVNNNTNSNSSINYNNNSNLPAPTTKISQATINSLQQHVQSAYNLHRFNKNLYGFIDQAIQIPLVIDQVLIASTANAPVNFDLPCSGTPPVHVTFTIQILGVIGALLAGLNQFIQPATKEQQHLQSEVKYNDILVDLIQLQELENNGTPQETQNEYNTILNQVREADDNAPDPFFDCSCFGGGFSTGPTTSTS